MSKYGQIRGRSKRSMVGRTADVSNPENPAFPGRYYADIDSGDAPGIPACGAAPDADPERCASSQHTVHLVQRPDGRVLSLSTEPGASASNFSSGGLRIIDITDPAGPVEAGVYRTPGATAFPPPDLGVYAPGQVLAHGARVYIVWHSEGLRVLAVEDEGTLEEQAFFIPPDTPDPTDTLTGKAYVVGVALLGPEDGDPAGGDQRHQYRPLRPRTAPP